MCCNRLLQIDFMLFNLLSNWTYNNDIFCNDEFQPDKILKDIENHSYNSYFEDSESEFDSLKFINIL